MPFRLFHLVLGLGLFVMSVETLLHAIQGGHTHLHLALVAGLEAAGAALFLVPKTLQVGGALLLITLLGAVVLHAFQREWRLDLLIYAAGVWLVMSGRR